MPTRATMQPGSSPRALRGTLLRTVVILLLCACHASAANPETPAPAPAASDTPTASGSHHWSFQPLQQPTVPAVRNQRWVLTELDRFVLARRESEGQAPRPDADARTWVRRVTFDLTGLPPTPEEVDGFLRDSSSAARKRVVERLLASPRYGERWGRHWLDLARYADTAGDSSDYPIPQAHKYRDYVIAAFNQDKPYDQFIREQIAGDLLPSETLEQWREQTIATGFIAISRRFSVDTGLTVHLTIEDTLEVTGRTILGLSLSCARCHDHKNDPITMEDYYALYGIFASTRYPHAGSETMRYQTNFVPLISWAELEALGRPYLEKVGVLDAEIARIEKQMENEPEQSAKSQELKAAYEKVWEKREDLMLQAPHVDAAYAVQEAEPRNVRVQERGDPAKLGSEVPRRFLRVLGGQPLPDSSHGSGRLELAGWLTHEAAPLAARVMVNRIWQHHFGWSLVDSPSDFGSKGSPPKDRALLDYLATRFIESGWSVKEMHRLLLFSSTHAQVAANHSPGAPAWAPERRRLDAEEIRDALLAVSGELDLEPGGEHPFPHPSKWDFTQHVQFQAVYATRKRSVYLMQQRLKKHPFLALFDGPDPNVSTAQRGETTTPLQALFMMNDALAHELAGKFAQRLQRERRTDPERVDWAHQLAFGRPARPEEIQDALAYLARVRPLASTEESAEPAAEAWASYTRALLGSNEFFFVE